MGQEVGRMLYNFIELIGGVTIKDIENFKYLEASSVVYIWPYVQTSGAKWLPFTGKSVESVRAHATIYNIERTEIK